MTLETLTAKLLSDPKVKVNNEGEKEMNYEYQGYTLQVEKVIKDGVLVDYKGFCKELGNFTISGMNGYTNMINRFKTEVDLKTEQIDGEEEDSWIVSKLGKTS